MNPEKYTVIAWTEERQEWDGEPFAADLGRLPKFRAVLRPFALVWSRGDERTQAEAYAAKMEHPASVFVLNSETPLEDARARIMQPEPAAR